MVSGFFLGGLAEGFQNQSKITNQQDYQQSLLKLEQQRMQQQQQNQERNFYLKLREQAISDMQNTATALKNAHPDWTDTQLMSYPALTHQRDQLSQFDKNLGLDPNAATSILAGFASGKSQIETEGALARAKEGPQRQALIQSEIEKNKAAAGLNPDGPAPGEGLGDKATFNQRFAQAAQTDTTDKGEAFIHSLPGARGLNAKGLYDGTTPLTAFSTRTGRGNTKSQRQQAVEDAETYGELIGKPFDINVAANRKIAETSQNKADATTLTELTKNRQALSAFEDTAKENTKLLIDLAKKVPNTGSPLLNMPIRSVAKSALGNENVAAFNLQLQSVKNELSRIITNPRLVGQLTDNARSEMNAALDEGATVGMIMKAYQTVQKDFQNRSAGLDKSISEVKDRLSGKKEDVSKRYKFNPDTGELE